MRLKTIKLAGFKSFVDPTSVDFPSNMCAVVGPNGCGKSNIIDAVRWVMGESSAKNLRGEAMTDVIFNGSGSRKPVGQASIELIFDNSDGTITGEYAGYSEISIKRRVTRDAQNLYYLNGNRCRRRDITDIFLGTGLGPRSYAIIEQGMISRLIEAKPEDLRVYIEEAAGISKYKERRKDTENRMRRTQENLERLTDIRDELERQLVRLERQAKAAEKYGELKLEERSLNAKLRVIRYQSLKRNADDLTKGITDAELGVEAAVTKRVRFDTEIEKHRRDFSDRSDKFNEIQGQFYALGADIARIEQSIKHTQERERSLRIDIEQTERDYRESEQHLAMDSGKIEGWEAELLEIGPELELLEQTMEESNAVLMESEEAMQAWQQDWDTFNQRASEPKQQAEVQQSRIQYLEQVQQRLHQRKQKIDDEHASISLDEDEAEIALVEEELAERELEADQKSDALAKNGEEIISQREQLTKAAEDRQQHLGELQTRQGRLASLEALQTAALGKDSGGNNVWFDKHQLQSEARLAESIDVENGWETALEVVLGDTLQAVVTGKPVLDFVSDLNGLESSVDLLSSLNSPSESRPVSTATLLSKVKSQHDLSPWLAKVMLADSLPEAIAALSELNHDESVITRDGIWFSKNWIRIRKQDDTQSGVIARKREIDTLSEEIESQTRICEELAENILTIKTALEDAEATREQNSRDLEQQRRQASELRAQLVSKKSRIEQLVQQQARAKQDIAEIISQSEQESENLSEARTILEEAISRMEADSEERENLLNRRDTLRKSLDDARQEARKAQDRSHELAMRNRSAQAQLDSMKMGVVRLQEQISRMQERREQLRVALEESSTPVGEHELQLEALLEKRSSVEQKLNAARTSMEATETALREAEKSRDQAEQEIGVQRNKLESARLELKALDVQAQNIHQQLAEDEFELDAVLAELSEEDNEPSLQTRIGEVERSISRLGAINLAAIEEYKIEAERKLYLDEQNQDLCEALETLEGAIRKIDKETRTRFSETYEQVNSGLQELFPRLFGGGHAYLELTGDDMLDTGIAIMARPPGKKNSTIHLLSGGEKALTAIALVFSIFQLNPAPFCMLDEVDAPLDDANVGRYANMVEAMSEKVQFIYITHNKIAMEKGKHLMGVTMQEAGVSRMVTVDVEEAAELAAL